jgi:hypothetical protein
MLKLSSYKGCRNERLQSVGRVNCRPLLIVLRLSATLRGVKLAAEIDLVENGYANSSRTI